MSIFVNKHQLNFQVNVLYLITNIICKADINYIFQATALDNTFNLLHNTNIFSYLHR